MITETIIGLTIVGGIAAAVTAVIVVEEVDAHKKRAQELENNSKEALKKSERVMEEAKAASERAERESKAKIEYWASMTSEDKAAVETEKEKTEQKRLELKIKEADARKAEAESKQAVLKYKKEILEDVRREAIQYVKEDSIDLFNSWVTAYDSKIDRKLDKLSDKIDEVKKDMADDDDLSRLQRKVDNLTDADDFKDLKREVERLKDKVMSGQSSSSGGSSTGPNIVVTNH